MSSSGGILTVGSATRHAERTLLSGPVGGVNAALALGRAIGAKDLITCDMGGTSTDVCLIENLTPTVLTESLIEGVSFKAAHIDIHTVGAGGGSVARSDAPGVFRVGPESAGARPGPVCYNFGGTEPTVTDANLALGRLGTGGLIGGRMELNKKASLDSIAELGKAIGIPDIQRVAEGIIEVAVTKMVGAIREISVQRGHDPRAYALVCFGGAGPMHGAEIARELGIADVIIPNHPGNFSAMGLMSSDFRHDYVRTLLSLVDKLSIDTLHAGFCELEETGRKELLSEGVARDQIEVMFSADMRYVGQGSEIAVSIRKDAVPSALANLFHTAHQQTYGHSRVDHPVQLVNLRAAAIGHGRKPSLGTAVPPSVKTKISRRSIVFDGIEYDCPIFDRHRLPPGWTVTGPAVVEEFGSTTVLPPGWQARVDLLGNIRLAPVVSN